MWQQVHVIKVTHAMSREGVGRDQGVVQEDEYLFLKTYWKTVFAKGSTTSNLLHHFPNHHPATHAQVKVSE